MTTTISASTISKQISKLDLPKSECSRGRVSDHYSEGYRVINTDDGIRIDYVNASTSMKTTDAFLCRQFLAIEKMFIELSFNGYETTLEWPSIKVGA